ncbi:hypothetical protein BDZ85DRAFT_256659 [Elsinoe ampelina]|uniref:Glucose-methanol-choline oxidoreductase N-terminal domain-containing protein n=1 Tax=Elsinoe ampelina TaxID=302913 RepID=A0A6A6GLX2_9PEZI|nr:hypothetical protein BDZ85DRAFT_256659 [Elsinoe ampelina]
MPGRTSSIEAEEYDFIIVGAGSAACLITSRLSQRLPDHRILVVEAGEHIQNDPNIQTPGLFSTLYANPAYDWDYSSASEPGLNGRKLKHPRGRLVGGTSAINSHSVCFPNTEWQDRVAELLPESGRAEWSSQGMKDCYSRWQSISSGLTGIGSDGDSDRVRTSYPRSMDFLQKRWVKIFENMGHAACAQGFAESSAGALTITNAVDSSIGERSHAATAFMEPALKRGNVILKTGVKVNKILFEETPTSEGKLVASGVHYTYQDAEHHVKAKQVIICTGVFESPAILERSGIGSKDVLTAAGIPLRYELPGVGENLQDHLNCGLSREVLDDVPTHDNALLNDAIKNAEKLEYELSRTGVLSEGAAYSFAFTPLQMLETEQETQELLAVVDDSLKKEQDSKLQTQYSVIRKALESPQEATSTTIMVRNQRHRDLEALPKGTPRLVDANFVTVVAMLAHPFSRGSSHICPDSPHQSDIKFNYLSHPLDTEVFARHMRWIERLFDQPSFAALLKPNGKRLPRSYPHPITTLEDARKLLPVSAATNYHPCGTCSMMREDLGGVVDEQLRVYGTENVRVCDASVLPIIPRGNILTAVYAYAEKAAKLVCRETSLSRS